MAWYTYPRNDTLVHQQLSLHQLPLTVTPEGGAFCLQHFEYGSNYGHVFPVSRALARMSFSVSRPLIRMHDTH